LFYLDWLMDHRGDFQLLVLERLGPDVNVEWSNSRLVCVAGNLTGYDRYAVAQMIRSIELVRYRKYDQQLLARTHRLHDRGCDSGRTAERRGVRQRHLGWGTSKTVSQYCEGAPQQVKDLYDSLE
jgi:hypothetical protein